MHSANLRACVNRSLSVSGICVFTVSEVLTFSFELEGNNKVFLMDIELVSSKIVLVGFKSATFVLEARIRNDFNEK